MVRIYFKLEHDEEQITNFNLAEAVMRLCDEQKPQLNAETVAI